MPRTSYRLAPFLLLAAVLPAGGSPPASSRPAGPAGLMVELLRDPSRSRITDARPEVAWQLPEGALTQVAYQLQLSEGPAGFRPVRDSGRVASAESVAVTLPGPDLTAHRTYRWRVRVWDASGRATPFSDPQTFHTGDLSDRSPTPPQKPDDRTFAVNRMPLVETPVPPVRAVETAPGRWFLDFGRAAYGWLRVRLRSEGERELIVRFGEKADGDRVDMQPGATIRAGETRIRLAGPGEHRISPPDLRRPAAAVGLPPSVGTVLPFRYAEVAGLPEPPLPGDLRQVAVHYPFDDTAARFECSDLRLNRIWELCRYSIRATSFAGLYVDGDRERIPYEADAFINQLAHYCTDREYNLARATHEYLLANPTWPTEWKHHSILMAWEDYLHTGDRESLQQHYEVLRRKLMLERLRPDGLLGSGRGDIDRNDIVDWPAGERDGYVKTEVNTVVNAFHCRSLALMERIAEAVERPQEAAGYRSQAAEARRRFHELLYDSAAGRYRDGVGTEHASAHANFFPLAFGLVPRAEVPRVLAYVRGRGMACSVYGAQYLLDALFEAGDAETALRLITDPTTDRSWESMVRAGATITWEAWANRYKPNQDWNHAWGAAPANLLPRHVLGVQPETPGFARARIRPQLGLLRWAAGRVPTIRGPVEVEVRQAGHGYRLRCRIPGNMTARVALPAAGGARTLRVDGEARTARPEGGWVEAGEVGPGSHEIVLE